MPTITASFPFKHKGRTVAIGEVLEVDDVTARTKIADGHARSGAVQAAPKTVSEPEQAVTAEAAPIPADSVAAPAPVGTSTGTSTDVSSRPAKPVAKTDKV